MKKILIADDAVFMRMMLRDLLTQHGFTIAGEAENGQEAVELFDELKPDLLIIDILMPIMDGLTAVEKILRKHPDAKIAMITAMGQRTYIDRAKEIGVKTFITKPFSPQAVIDKLNSIF